MKLRTGLASPEPFASVAPQKVRNHAPFMPGISVHWRERGPDPQALQTELWANGHVIPSRAHTESGPPLGQAEPLPERDSAPCQTTWWTDVASYSIGFLGQSNLTLPLGHCHAANKARENIIPTGRRFHDKTMPTGVHQPGQLISRENWINNPPRVHLFGQLIDSESPLDQKSSVSTCRSAARRRDKALKWF